MSTMTHDTAAVAAAIATLETLDKQGESYGDANGRHGWRNPIRQDTGHLLTTLTLAASPARVLEVGTGHGLSTLYLASGLTRPDAALDTIELDPRVADGVRRRVADLGLPVQVFDGDALEVIAGLEHAYDLVFLDAQKDQYLPYLMALRDRGLLRPGAVILADNVIDRREECRAFLDWFAANDVPHRVIATECGLLVARLEGHA